MSHRIVVDIERPDPALVERFKAIPPTLVSEWAGRSRIMDSALKPLKREWYVCGPAVTVKADLGGFLMPATAPKVCRPGDVVVVAANGQVESSVWSASFTRAARVMGCAGAVVDGVVEAWHSILTLDVPVFCRGVYPVYGAWDKPGSINVPVVCGGVAVEPGDLIIGDYEAVYALPRKDLPEAIEFLEERTRWLENRRAQMETAMLFDLRGGMDLLAKAGVEWVGTPPESR
jgi:4-hydroxy-4-methyl-2-oxoglutarate aldolase